MKNKKSLFIIFGASRGLGRALAEQISKFKDNVLILADRKLAKPLIKNSSFLRIDLSRILPPSRLSGIFSRAVKAGYKDIYLINNASVIKPIKPVGRQGRKVLAAFNVNFLNYTLIINEFIKRSKSFGSTRKKILNITSGAATSPQYGLSSYCSGKAALEMFSRCVFLEQQELKQVKILAFRPGVMNTGMQQTMRNSAKQDFSKAVFYRELFEKNKLLSPARVAESLYQVLTTESYWRQPVLDISEIN